mmetsp:Transcript_2611/g.5649  ORF Transcript_2611/g.5649 Transcript_2611/m.5649 type:complete len:147 (-) Transcript_2611:876-1316(-)
MSRTMQGRGRGCGGRNNSGRGNGRGYHRSFKSNNNKPVKTKLEDHVFHLGTARRASDYDSNKDFLINYIKQEFEYEGHDIAKALEDLKHPIVEGWEPQVDDYISTETDEEKKKDATALLMAKYKMKMDIYEKRKKPIITTGLELMH